MFCINVWLTVNDPANVEKVKGLLTELAPMCRTEPGCVSYNAYHSQSDRTKFLLVEQWSDKAAWEVHRTAEGFVRIYQPQVLPLVTRDPHPSDRL